MHAHTGGLARIVRACAEHPRRTFAIWFAVIVAIVVSSAAFGGKLVNEFTIPGTDSQAARTLLQERFPAFAGDSARLVFSSRLPLTAAVPRREIGAAIRAAARVQGVVSVGDPYAGREGAVSKNGRIGLVVVQFDKPASQITTAQINELEGGVKNAIGASPTTRVEFGGQVIEGQQADSSMSERLGLAAAIVVLLLALGSAVAMAVPITLALVAVGCGLSLLTLAAAFTNFNKVTPILAVMIGLGVAIDYALFIVTRFRQSLAEGEAPVEAAVTAGSTAGRAVIFAGTTVAISVSGLALVGIPFVTKLGLGSAIAVVVAVCTAVTLLPAILAKLGHRIERGRLPFVARNEPVARRTGKILRFAGFVTSHPKTALRRVARRVAGARGSGAVDDARHGGRRDEPRAHHHAEGIRPGGQGLRSRLQRPAGRRRRPARSPWRRSSPRRRVPFHTGRGPGGRSDHQPSSRYGRDQRLPGRLAPIEEHGRSRSHAA
jgi:RND superfamily putative drug exporter